jgi:hypothetical protein
VARFDRVIPPGKEGQIEASVDTTHYTGHISKSLTVKTNDPEHGMASLEMSADVRAFVDLLPGWKATFVTDKGKAAQQVLYLKNLDTTEPLDVVGATSDNSHVKPTITRMHPGEADAGKGDFRVVLDLDAETPIGPVTGAVTVTTTHKRQRTLEIALDGRVNGPISYFPYQVVMYKDRSGREPRLTGMIVLQTRPGEPPIKPGKIETGDPRLAVEKLTDPATGMLRLGLTWTAPEAKGVVEGKVRIETGLEAMPLVEVPYQVRID